MKFSSRENKKILDRTTDIIQKYYKESEINPVLKYKSPEELKKSFDLKIPKK
jgi:hypothetical protein